MARSLSRPSKVIVKVFIRFNSRHEVIESERDALCRCESVGHADCVFNLHPLISKQGFQVGSCRGSYLSPVEFLLAQIIELGWSELAPFSGGGDLICLLDESGPDLGLCFFA